MKLNSLTIPIWIILIVPPTILLLLPTSFIFNTAAFMIGLKLINYDKKIKIYFKYIFQIWIINIIIYIIASILLFISQLLPKTDFIYNNITYPLLYNPFTSIYSIIYIITIFIISALLIYIINNKIVFRKLELPKTKKRILSIIIAIITIPYIYLVPSTFIYNNTNKFDIYKDTYITDNQSIANIINLLPSGKNYSLIKLETSNPQMIIINYKKEEYNNIYKTIEHDATILFYLIKKADIIEFNINDDKYQFHYDDINKFYNNELKQQTIDDIEKIYQNDNFNLYQYLGIINQYQLFDIKQDKNKTEIFKDDNYKYILECSNIDNLYLIRANTKIRLKDALNQNIIAIDDILKTNLIITKEKVH